MTSTIPAYLSDFKMTFVRIRTAQWAGLSITLLALVGCGLTPRKVDQMQQEREPKKIVKNIEKMVDYFEKPVRDPITGGMAMSALVDLSQAWSPVPEDEKLTARGIAAVESVHERLINLADGVPVDVKRITKGGGDPVESAAYLRGWAVATLGNLDAKRHADLLLQYFADPSLIADRNAQLGIAAALVEDVSDRLRQDDDFATQVLVRAARVAAAHREAADQAWMLHLAEAVLRPTTLVAVIGTSAPLIADDEPAMAVLLDWGCRQVEYWAAEPTSALKDGRLTSITLARCALRPHVAIHARRMTGQRIAAADPAATILAQLPLLHAKTPRIIVVEALEDLVVAAQLLSGTLPSGVAAPLGIAVLHPSETAEAALAQVRTAVPALLDGGFLQAKIPLARRGAILRRWTGVFPDLVLTHVATAGLQGEVDVDTFRLHLDLLGSFTSHTDNDLAHRAAIALCGAAARAARQREEAEALLGRIDHHVPANQAGIQAEQVRLLLNDTGPNVHLVARLYRSALIDLAERGMLADPEQAQHAADGFIAAIRQHDPATLAVVAHSADLVGAQCLLRSLAQALLSEGQEPTANELVLMRDLARATAGSTDESLRAAIFTGLLRNVTVEHEEVSLMCASLLLELYGQDADRIEAMTPVLLERWPALLGDA